MTGIHESIKFGFLFKIIQVNFLDTFAYKIRASSFGKKDLFSKFIVKQKDSYLKGNTD